MVARDDKALFARATTSLTDAETASQLVQLLVGNATSFSATSTIVATWNSIESYQYPGANRFQLVVAYSDQLTYVIFDYRELQFWGTCLFSLARHFGFLSDWPGH